VYDVPSDSEEEQVEKTSPDEKKVESEKDYYSDDQSMYATSLFGDDPFLSNEKKVKTKDSDEDSLSWDTTYNQENWYEYDFNNRTDEYYWSHDDTGKSSLLHELTYKIEAATASSSCGSSLCYYRKKTCIIMQYVAYAWSDDDEKTDDFTVKVKPHSNETKMEIIAPGIWMLIDRCHMYNFVWDFEEDRFKTLDELFSRLVEYYNPIDLNIQYRQAIAMATHPRLGAESWLGAIDPVILETIAMLV
jgi:hypothetical protein